MRVRASAIIEQDEHILLLKYRYGGNDVYNLPGGNPDAGESLPECVKRELLEELSISVDVQQLAVVAQGIAQRPQGLDSVLHMIFRGKILSGEVKINALHTSAREAIWLKLSALQDIILYPDIFQTILKALKEESHTPLYVEKFKQIWY